MAEHQQAPQEQHLPLRRCLVTPRYLEDLAGLLPLSAAETLLPAPPSPWMCQPACASLRAAADAAAAAAAATAHGEAAPQECSRLDAGATGQGLKGVSTPSIDLFVSVHKRGAI